ncbi:hypothetical protein CDAR_220931 [Caerostris darwini]|uniref:Uncharacterized protein n=1 Tax=Caerostris darwini TaxID=1538125 RepID=A0AAV4MTK9_9ARAC|nr:hypothetical protein CDAR_220931 [Caerostris darwini]
MEFSIDQATGPLKGQDGEPNYSVKADIPEGITKIYSVNSITTNINNDHGGFQNVIAHVNTAPIINNNAKIGNVNTTNENRNTREGNDARAKSPTDDIIKPAKLINISDDGFKTPGKKQTTKATEKHNPFRIPVKNKFANIEEETTSNAQAKETDDYSPTKLPPIMLALTANYTHALQEIHRKFPKTEYKLTKGYAKIFPYTEDSYRKMITYLTNANMNTTL